MVIDTSAIIAMMQEEEGFESLLDALSKASTRNMSAVSYMEAAMVLMDRRGERTEHDLDAMLSEALIAIVPVSVAMAQLAREGFRKYGKGRHPAGLNFGDCFTYALAKARNEPLLFVGKDFSQTDLLLV
jgi:ribonuclease VapC